MTSISPATFSLTDALRASVRRIQNELGKAQTEVTTGQVADVGLALGCGSARTVSLAQDRARLQGQIASNNLLSPKLQAGQSALDAVSGTADKLRSSLLGAGANPSAATVATLAAQAKDALQSLGGAMGTSVGGDAIFAGINTAAAPMGDYFADPPSPARAAVQGAFTAAFGFPPTDPAVATIDAGAMQSFLSGPFADLFAPPQWQSLWSSASDTPATARIGNGESVASVTANAPAMGKLAMAYTMLADLGVANMNAGAAQAVVTAATAKLSEGMQGVTDMQADLGRAQARVEAATTRLKAQQDMLEAATSDLVSVDPYAASVRLNDLQTQLQAAYTLTARLQNLTLVAFLPT